MGATDEEITLDFLLVYGPRLDEHPKQEEGKTIHNFMAGHQIHKFYRDPINLVEALKAAPKANIRFYFRPHDGNCPNIK